MDVFCYILGCEDTHKGLVIDPAGEEERILKTALASGLTIESVVNTHGHPDHTCGNRKIAEQTGAKIYMHALDDRFFNTPQGQSMAMQMGFTPSPSADVHLEDGDIIPFGDRGLAVLHTPAGLVDGVYAAHYASAHGQARRKRQGCGDRQSPAQGGENPLACGLQVPHVAAHEKMESAAQGEGTCPRLVLLGLVLSPITEAKTHPAVAPIWRIWPAAQVADQGFEILVRQEVDAGASGVPGHTF